MDERKRIHFDFERPDTVEWMIDPTFGIHVHQKASLGSGCKLSRNIVIEKGVTLGEGVIIGNNVTIGENAMIGNGVEILDGTIIYPDTTIGEETKILEYCHLGRPPEIAGTIFRKLKGEYLPLFIGNKCLVGPFVRIYRGTVIGDKTSIFEFVTVREECTIGNDVVLAPGVAINYGCEIGNRVRIMAQTNLVATRVEDGVFIGPNVASFNDDLKEIGEKREWKGPTIKKNVIIGANCTLGLDAEIGEGSIIGIGSTVTRNIPPHVFAAGVPAQVKRNLNES